MRERLTREQIVNLDVLLVPKGVVLPAEAGQVQNAASIIEAIKIVLSSEDDIPVIHIADKQVLDVFNKSADSFPLAIAVLDEVPGGDYDVVFNNFTHLLPSITIGALLEAEDADKVAVNMSAQAQMLGRPDTSGARVRDRGAAIASKAVGRAAQHAPKPTSLRDISADPSNDEADLGDTGQE